MSFDERVGKPRQEFGSGVVLPPNVPKELTTHDHFGLSLDPKHWAKSNCKRCNGLGVYSFMKNVPASDMIKGARGMNQTKITDACDCAIKAYQRVVIPLQDRALAIWHHPGLTDDKREEAVLALVREALVQVKHSGKISSVKEMVQAADEAAKRRVIVPRR